MAYLCFGQCCPSILKGDQLIPGPEQIHPALGVLDVGESTYQDQGSVNHPGRARTVGWSIVCGPGCFAEMGHKLQATSGKQLTN